MNTGVLGRWSACSLAFFVFVFVSALALAQEKTSLLRAGNSSLLPMV